GHAEADVASRAISRAFTHLEIELGARARADALRIRAARQHDIVEDVGVHQRHRPGIVDALHRAHEKGRGYAFKREVHMVDGVAANGELAAEVVARRDARQHLNRSKWVAGNDAAKLLQLAA